MLSPFAENILIFFLKQYFDINHFYEFLILLHFLFSLFSFKDLTRKIRTFLFKHILSFTTIHYVTQVLPSVVFCLQNWCFQNNWSCLFTEKVCKHSLLQHIFSIMHRKLNSWQCKYYNVYNWNTTVQKPVQTNSCYSVGRSTKSGKVHF